MLVATAARLNSFESCDCYTCWNVVEFWIRRDATFIENFAPTISEPSQVASANRRGGGSWGEDIRDATLELKTIFTPTRPDSHAELLQKEGSTEQHQMKQNVVECAGTLRIAQCMLKPLQWKTV